MIKLTQEHLEALLDKFGGECNPPSIYLEVSYPVRRRMYPSVHIPGGELPCEEEDVPLCPYTWR